MNGGSVKDNAVVKWIQHALHGPLYYGIILIVILRGLPVPVAEVVGLEG
jgi:hypothetical protein